MKYDAILIDVANIYWASYATSQHLTMETSEGTLVTGGVYTFLKSIQKLQREHLAPKGKFYFLFDNTSSVESRRKQIDPAYKANRQKKDPIFYKGLDYLHLILLSYENSWVVIRRPGSEADDLVEAVLRHLPEACNKLMVSADFDWARGIRKNVDWLERNSGNIINEEVFLAEHGYPPSREAVCMYKSFRGDASDNIEIGVERIPEKVLKGIVNTYKSLDDMFFHLRESDIPPQWQDAIRNRKGRLYLNYTLVDYEPITDEEFIENSTLTKFERNKLERLYKVLGFQPTKVDPRFSMEGTPTEEGEGFFDFEEYGRA